VKEGHEAGSVQDRKKQDPEITLRTLENVERVAAVPK
jgi:hypothetical protein